MDGFNILLLLISISGFGAILWFLKNNQGAARDQEVTEKLNHLVQENADLKAKLEQKIEEIGRVQSELETEKSEKNKLEGNGKQLFAQLTGYKEENKSLRGERDRLKEKVTRVETDRERQERDFLRLSEQLENARKKLQEEQERVKREDEEKLEQEKQEHDRLWNEHENIVLAKLKEICQSQQIGFAYYENKKLPDGFDGSLKPDFLVEFLEQYIIFDAKKSKHLGDYLNDQVKKTAAKIQKSSSSNDVYPVIFFMVPTEELKDLKKTFWYEEGFSFFAIAVESIESILAAYKRITDYEKISEFDPQDREKIVDLIARYDRHISFQNAANILLAKEGSSVMSSKENINEQVREEIEVKKKSMRQPKLNESELKRLSRSIEEQGRDVEKLVSPKVMVDEQDLEEVQKSLL